jgi:prolyl oligopeptidase
LALPSWLVKERNAETTKELAAWPDFGKLEADLLAVLDSEARMPYVGKECGRLYNFWQDASHPRGVWRRTTFDEYRKPEPKWDVLLDLDALAKAEGETWFWQEARVLFPGCHRPDALPRTGGDANRPRFDVDERRFVGGGLRVEGLIWIDAIPYVSGTSGRGR